MTQDLFTSLVVRFILGFLEDWRRKNRGEVPCVEKGSAKVVSKKRYKKLEAFRRIVLVLLEL